MNKAVPVPRGADPVTSTLPPGHPPVAYGRIGVLIVNLGTPDGTDYWSMRRYLREFLSDRRVIEVNRVLWWFLLNVVILSRRPQAKGKDYETIWNKERNEGPLRTITRAQSEKLSAALAPLDRRLVVDWAMRYGNPSIASRIEALQKIGCERILLVPLYPQYAAATSATVCDAAFDQLKKMRWQPVLRVAPHWPDEPAYIEALANSITTELAKLDWEPELVLASFHGIPKSYFVKGDPYQCYCHQTTRLVREKLGWPEGKLKLTFQSRFGKEEWLQPYTDKTVEALAKSGVKKLAVITPGFVADCLETLEEIGGENAEIFLHNGGEKFHFIPCLNDSDGGMAVLEAVVKRELRGWVDLD
ncbi:ferrochelatase [Ancylobacter sp. G4_0304]|uniref:ferrochelatase n=1 Tax=Ancylobacter sp. G4_0304 TaxID=3114289 RepID=UPI0039C6B0BF